MYVFDIRIVQDIVLLSTSARIHAMQSDAVWIFEIDIYTNTFAETMVVR